MPVETFNYLDSLVPTNPVTSEGIVNGDDHIRGIKSTLKTTFPNITGAITASQDALNAAGAATVNGVALLADAGVFFKTSATDGFLNTLAGDIDVQLQGVIAATFQRTAGANFFKVNGAIQTTGSITATGEIKGPGITPIGASVLWFDDVLPLDGLWVWANGQVITNAATVAPILLARWGTKFGGNGTTTLGVPDLRETVPVGKSTMGGTTARGLITQFTSTLLTTIGGLFGEALHVLQISETPAHRHSVTYRDPGHVHGQDGQTLYGDGNVGSGVGGGGAFGKTRAGNVTLNGTGITITSGDGVDNATGPAGSSVAHNNVQPSTVCNFIIRIG